MRSITELYRIGRGPSSSHTLGPARAAAAFRERTPAASAYRVSLYGSLAATGRGHLSDVAVRETLAPAGVEIVWKPDELLPLHPNGMRFEAVAADGSLSESWDVYSVGGGALLDACGCVDRTRRVYPHRSLTGVLRECTRTGRELWEYVFGHEAGSFSAFLSEVWQAMQAVMATGLRAEGALPGDLGLRRKAGGMYRRLRHVSGSLRRTGLIAAYALAVAEENASGRTVVTAPTCGSAGVLPAVLRYLQESEQVDDDIVVRALATAGLVGNLIKMRASISGAEVGCQGEVGAACAMAAAAAAQILGGSIRQIEYAAEMGIEHFLGLTCDPIGGYVQIPCIERNAIGASRALALAEYALLSDGTHRVSFDQAVDVMKSTGRDLPSLYRETALGGLAVKFRNRAAFSG